MFIFRGLKSCLKGYSQCIPISHRTIIQIAFISARKLRAIVVNGASLPADQRASVASAVESILSFVILSLRELFDQARMAPSMTGTSEELESDLALLVAVFQQLIRPEVCPHARTWLASCQEVDLFRASLDVFVRAQPGPDGRSNYLQPILALHLSLSTLPASAERLALDGLMAAFTSTHLTPEAEAGSIDVSSLNLPGERNPTHIVWCSMLAIVAQTIGSLGPVAGAQFIESEVVAFVQLYGGQLGRALDWKVGLPLTLPLLEEIELVIALFSAISERTISGKAPPGMRPSDSPTSLILRAFSERSLHLLQHLTYVLLHPNHLSTLIEPTTSEERLWLEQDSGPTLQSISESDAVNAEKRPVLAGVMQALLLIGRDLVLTLIGITNAEVVLMKDVMEWSLHQAIVVPVSPSIFSHRRG